MLEKILQICGFGLGGILCAIACNVVLLRFAKSLGIRNKNDIVIRWSSESKPSLGGVSFFVVFIFAAMAYSVVYDEENIFQNKQYVGLLFSGSLAFAMGLADDAYNTRPLMKLLVQFICGVLFVFTGSVIELFDSMVLNAVLTIFWVIVVMNALNMLDNMDGITGTTAFFILCTCIISNWLIFGLNVNIWTLLMVSMSGALLGFLKMNVHPSQLFMGDAGSQFISLFVAYFGMEYLWNAGVELKQSPWLGILVALVAFTAAAVDTSTVVINRLRKGRSPLVGGKDHTTHHLVYAGFTDRQVWYVFVFIGFCSMFLAIAMIHLIKMKISPPTFLFITFTLTVFVVLYRNTIKYSQPNKK